MQENYYEVLNVSINATEEEIAVAYKRLVCKCTDINECTRYNSAFEVLSNSRLRKEYDFKLDEKIQNQCDEVILVENDYEDLGDFTGEIKEIPQPKKVELKSNVIGIHLGFYMCKLSYIKDGKPVMIENEKYGYGPYIPSAMIVTKEGAILGRQAEIPLTKEAVSNKIGLKRLIGGSNSISGFMGLGPLLDWILDDEPVTLTHKKSKFKKTYIPKELFIIMLKKLKDIAEEEVGKVSEAVITVPADFMPILSEHCVNEYIKIIEEASEAAGLSLKKIITEPSAIASAYSAKNCGVNGNILICNLEAGYFVCSVLEIKEGTTRIVEHSENTYLSYVDDYGDWHGGENSKLAKIEEVVNNTLKSGGITADEIDYVLTVGKFGVIPKAHNMLKRKFGDKVLGGVNPEEAVAIGTSWHAAMNSGN